jgi:hypothetical protein
MPMKVLPACSVLLSVIEVGNARLSCAPYRMWTTPVPVHGCCAYAEGHAAWSSIGFLNHTQEPLQNGGLSMGVLRGLFMCTRTNISSILSCQPLTMNNAMYRMSTPGGPFVC